MVNKFVIYSKENEVPQRYEHTQTKLLQESYICNTFASKPYIRVSNFRTDFCIWILNTEFDGRFTDTSGTFISLRKAEIQTRDFENLKFPISYKNDFKIQQVSKHKTGIRNLNSLFFFMEQ